MSYSRQKKDEIKLELETNPDIKEKYRGAGIYTIKIDDILVYIGKSQDLLERVVEHIAEIQNIDYHSSNKYKVMAQAQRMGHSINFDVIYYCPFTFGNQMIDDIGFTEGKYIRKYLPFLNVQIPKEEDYRKYTYNKRAKYITLDSILYEGKLKNSI